MKSFLVTIFLFFSLGLSAQDTALPKFESMKLTSAPAYTILGVDPQNIQRPATPTDFIAGAQTALVNGKLQPNFALEATPYYWKHPKTDDGKRISLYSFLKPKNSFIDNLAQTFTFSFASSESDTLVFGDLDPGLGIGFGFKCNLFNGNISRKTLVQISSLIESKLINNLYQSIMGKLSVGDPVIVNNSIEGWETKKRKKDDNGYNALLDYVADFVRNDLGKARLTQDDINILQKKISRNESKETKALASLNEAVFPLTREGFMLELAFGDAAIIQNNEWAETINAKTAIWLTPSYRVNTRKDPTVVDFLDFMAVIRLIGNNSKVDKSNYFDAGGKIQYTHNKFSFSGEYIARMLTQKPATAKSRWTNRVDLSFDYKLNSFVTFKATFGRNFDGNSVHYTDPSKMFAVGGLNFGFGEFLEKENGSK
jgi:hypothetical protein